MPKLKVTYDDGTTEEVEATPENRLKYKAPTAKPEKKWSGQTYLDAGTDLLKAIPRTAVEALPSVMAGASRSPIGYVAGSGIKQSLQSAAPSVFGNRNENVLEETIKDLVLNKVGDKAFSMLGSGAGKLYDAATRPDGFKDLIANTMLSAGKKIKAPFANQTFNSNLDDASRQAFSKPTITGRQSEVPLTVGQVTGNQGLEFNFAPREVGKQSARGQAALRLERQQLGESLGPQFDSAADAGEHLYSRSIKGLEKVTPPGATLERLKFAHKQGMIPTEVHDALVAIHNGSAPSKLLGKMIKTPETAETISRLAGKEAVASGWYSNFMDNFSTPDGFKGAKALEAFSDPRFQDITRRFLGSEQRGQIQLLLKRAKMIEPITGAAGGAALTISEGGAKIDFTTAGAKRVTAFLGMQQFVEKVMLDKKYARIAADLVMLPPESAKAKELGALLFKGLKGVQFSVDAQP